MSFFSGLVTGLASSADTSIKKYLESDNQLKSKLAEKRIARAETEEARFRKEFDEYKRDIKGLAKKAGSVDNAQYLLNKFGYDAGTTIINNLYSKQLQGGKSIADLFSLQERVGPSVTVDQLATFYTPPAKIGSGESMKGVGGNISKMFGGENWIQKAVMKETDAVVGKLTKSSLSEIPETLTAINDLENYEIGYSLDYNKEHKRLLGVATQFLNKGDVDKAAKIKISADANWYTMKNLEKTEYSAAELKAVGKDFEKRLINVHSIAGKYDVYNNFISPAKSKEAYKAVTDIVANFESEANMARKFGMDATYIKLKFTEAITKNRVPNVVPASDAFSKGTIVLTDEKLYTSTSGPQGSGGVNVVTPSTKYTPSSVASVIAMLKTKTGSDLSLAIIDQRRLYSVNNAGLNELNKQLKQNNLQ